MLNFLIKQWIFGLMRLFLVCKELVFDNSFVAIEPNTIAEIQPRITKQKIPHINFWSSNFLFFQSLVKILIPHIISITSGTIKVKNNTKPIIPNFLIFFASDNKSIVFKLYSILE